MRGLAYSCYLSPSGRSHPHSRRKVSLASHSNGPLQHNGLSDIRPYRSQRAQCGFSRLGYSYTRSRSSPSHRRSSRSFSWGHIAIYLL